MNNRLVYVLVDDHVSQVIYIEILNQLCEHMLRNMGLDITILRHCKIVIILVIIGSLFMYMICP